MYALHAATQAFQRGPGGFGGGPMGGPGLRGPRMMGAGGPPLGPHLLGLVVPFTIFLLIVGLGILVWYFATHRGSLAPSQVGGWQLQPQAVGAAPDLPVEPVGLERAEAIARERLAAGKITAEQYSAIAETLEQAKTRP